MKISFNTNADLNHHSFSEDYLSNMLNKFVETINNPLYGFFHMTDDYSHIEKSKSVYEKFKHKKYFVQIGIGGSALGPQMLIDALGDKKKCQFIWLDNTDSEYLNDELNKIDPKESLFYVVSKSGGTAETLAALAICQELLRQAGVTEDNFKDYFVFCTDPVKSDLRELSNDFGYIALDIPSNIGGRFSVLTAVGLLPALFAGIDIDKLFLGANNIKSQLLNKDIKNNPLIETAAHLAYLFFEEQGKGNPQVNQTIVMPYSSKLKNFSHWFVQLWGESLGKYSTEKGINTGLTPIPAYGATDQHSQMQLFMEGTNDKFLFLIEVKNKNIDFKLNNTIPKDSAKKLNGYTINQLIEAQFYGTLAALKERKRNIAHVVIDQNDEVSMGEMILFFESLTTLMGHYLLVDPFNQPGVELGKKYAFEYLSKF